MPLLPASRSRRRTQENLSLWSVAIFAVAPDKVGAAFDLVEILRFRLEPDKRDYVCLWERKSLCIWLARYPPIKDRVARGGGGLGPPPLPLCAMNHGSRAMPCCGDC